MASSKTKFFRVAVEGATVDGREIKREWLVQMAKHYDPALFGARINVEHVKGFAPMSATNPFGSYGDVIALSTKEIEEGPLKGKMALYAQINPTDELISLTKKRQKIYTSIEVNPSFADLDEAYLVGVAATDSPASLGTESLQFAARRSSNLFSAPCETSIEIEEASTPTSLLSIVKAMFARNRIADDERNGDVRRAVEEIANFAGQQSQEIDSLRHSLELAQQSANDARQRADEAIASVEQLTETLSTADNGAPRRPLSTGSTGEVLTDC
ncbi:GPO family capsid scaffolding protein [Caballeronia sp. NCTM5]|uniref:GPO family capsid scaffolding protein n=1 Tax=Caballeronia sp. NCTM5 TaxID=2921755 RepID=UPI0020285963|nr:GPO family capsid scaffolding protein [Caballeronia sp. NCTM5]